MGRKRKKKGFRERYNEYRELGCYPVHSLFESAVSDARDRYVGGNKLEKAASVGEAFGACFLSLPIVLEHSGDYIYRAITKKKKTTKYRGW